MKSTTFVLFFGIMMLLSCKKDNCPSKIDLGELSLLETSKAKFPYQPGIKRLVFKQSNGEEFYYQLIDFKSYHETGRYGSTCEDDEDVVIENDIKLEHLEAMFADTTSRHLFIVDMWVHLSSPFPADKMAADVLKVAVGELSNPTIPTYSATDILMIIAVNNRTYPANYQESYDNFLETTLILGKTFNDVYVYGDVISPPVKQLFYYNHAQGVVGFTDEDGQHLKVLDRVE